MDGPAKAESVARAAGTSFAYRYGLALLSVGGAFALAHALVYLHLPQTFTALALSAIAITFWYAGIGPGVFAVLLSLLVRSSIFESDVGALSRALYALVFVLFGVLMTFVARGRRELEKRVAERTKELTAANEELKQKMRQLAITSDTLQKSQSDLARANRVTTLGELTAALAHEVNQPIGSAVTNAQACLRWLGRAPPDLDEARAAALRIVGDGTRAADIIGRTRLLFTKGEPQRESVDLNVVIRDTLAILQGEAARHEVVLRIELATDLPRGRGDPVQLQQVVMNLMVNGIDAMSAVEGERELTIRSGREKSGGLLISVLDTGLGLPADQADQIFEAFFTTKPHGVGMGLAVCRSIVQSHGGRLWAAGNAPRGAAFFFTLPADGTGAARC